MSPRVKQKHSSFLSIKNANFKYGEKGQAEILILVVLFIIIFYLFASGGFEKLKSNQSKMTFPQRPTQSIINKPTSISPAPKEDTSQKKEPEPAPQDNTPPKRSNPTPSGSLASSTLKTTISLKTDETANCRYSTYSGMHYDAMQGDFEKINSTSHSTLITTLTSGISYEYYVKCMDLNENKNADDFTISFKVQSVKDTTAPVRRHYSEWQNLTAGTKEIKIYTSTDEKARCRYSTNQGTSYGSMRGKFSANSTYTRHTATISGLSDGKTRDIFFRCQDFNSNANSNDILVKITIEASE